MALSLSSTSSFLLPCSKVSRVGRQGVIITKCELTELPSSSPSSSTNTDPSVKSSKLQVGSPIVIVEAPKMLKTAASVPCLRSNSGLVKPGDVGRIMSRKPKDSWAVRLKIGTYLIDGKYFKPLDLDENQ